MSTHQQYLIRSFRSFDFKNQVIWISIRYLRILKDQMKSYFLASILHSLQHLSIFHGNCGYWNCFAVLPACMNRVNWKRSNRSHQGTNSSVFGSVISSKDPVFYWMFVVCPLLVVYNDFAFYFIFTLLELIKGPNDNCVSFYVSMIKIDDTLKCFCLNRWRSVFEELAGENIE